MSVGNIDILGIRHVGKDMDKREYMYTVGVNVN